MKTISTRKRAVKMLEAGTPATEVAKEFNVSAQTVYNWRDQVSKSVSKSAKPKAAGKSAKSIKFAVDSEWLPSRSTVGFDEFRGAIIEHASKLKAGESFPIPVQELVRRYGAKSASTGAVRHVINRHASEDVAGRVVVHEVKDANKNLTHIRIRRPN